MPAVFVINIRRCRAGRHAKSRFAVSWSDSAPAVSYSRARGSEESKAATETCSRPIPTLIGNRAFSPLRNYTKPHRRNNCLVQISSEDSRLPSVLLTNVCHLQNKLDELSVIAKQYCPEIICITESWLTCNIPGIAVNLDGYHLIRKDISSGPGGGVAVYISSKPNNLL